MLIAGVIGYLLKTNGYPIAPLLLAYVLAPTLEVDIRRAFLMSGGSPLIFIQKPISAVLITVLLLTILSPIFKWVVGKIKLRTTLT